MIPVKGGVHYIRIARAAASAHLSLLESILGIETNASITGAEMRSRLFSIYSGNMGMKNLLSKGLLSAPSTATNSTLLDG